MPPLQLLPRANVLGWLLGQTLWEAPAKKHASVLGSGCEGLRVLMVFSFLRWSLVFFLTIRSGFICWIGCCDTWNIHTAVTPSNIKYQKKQMWHFFFGIGNHQATQFGAQTQWEFALEVGPPLISKLIFFLMMALVWDGICRRCSFASPALPTSQAFATTSIGSMVCMRCLDPIRKNYVSNSAHYLGYPGLV